MPAKDGTGPTGQGSRTGRGMGNCNPDPVCRNPVRPKEQNQSLLWRNRVWDAITDRLFWHKRNGKIKQK